MFCSSFIIFQSVGQRPWNLEGVLGKQSLCTNGQDRNQTGGKVTWVAMLVLIEHGTVTAAPLEATSPGPLRSQWVCRASVHCGI